MCAWVLKELAAVTARPFPIICERSRWLREGSWGLEEKNVIRISKKGKKEDWKKYKLVCLIFILRKWKEQRVLETICKHIRKRKWFRVASIDLRRGNDAWLTWQPSMMKWPAWWMREEKLMLFIFTLPKLLTLLPITSSLANWWCTAYISGQRGRLKTDWAVGLKELWSALKAPAGGQLLVVFCRW